MAHLKKKKTLTKLGKIQPQTVTQMFPKWATLSFVLVYFSSFSNEQYKLL